MLIILIIYCNSATFIDFGHGKLSLPQKIGCMRRFEFCSQECLYEFLLHQAWLVVVTWLFIDSLISVVVQMFIFISIIQ